jgi:hypothetical protein
MGENGKAYANRKKIADRPDGDLYHTPKSLVWELLDRVELNNPWECACGDGAITEVLDDREISYRSSDLSLGTNFLECDSPYAGDIFTNPPFSLWDAFVEKALNLSKRKVIMLGRTNYFGTQSRYESGIWEHLKEIYIFTRYVDYQTPKRDDGLFHVGALCTGWFIWDKEFLGTPTIDFIDVQKYAKLGAFKKKST